MTLLKSDPASFRDPSGRVFLADDCVFRTVEPPAGDWLQNVWQKGILQELAENGLLIKSSIADPSKPAVKCLLKSGAVHVLEHPRIPFISYPYEWPFGLLKEAALGYLNLHLEALKGDFTLSDASSFNMQVHLGRVLHIDALSIVPYKTGMPFEAYGQFQRQFLNPLILEAETGLSFAPFLKNSLDGISSGELMRLLPIFRMWRPMYLLHVLPTAVYDGRSHNRELPTRALPTFSKSRLEGLLKHLKSVISKLTRKSAADRWQSYENENSYSSTDREVKHRVVADFCSENRPDCLLDIGCNSGEYTATALKYGAKTAIGIDTDRSALETAWERASSKRQRFLPLAVDITNPSPSLGWLGTERAAFLQRSNGVDALLALAILHHLVIGAGIPLKSVVCALIRLAPRGLVEFIPKKDPQVQRLLRFRADTHDDYTLERFRTLLASGATIIAERSISATGRVVFHYAQHARSAER